MKSKHKQHMFNSAADTFNIFLFSSDADTKTGISQDMFTKLTNALDRHLYKFIVLFQLNLLRILCPKNIIINSTCIQRHALMPTAVNTANLAETHRQPSYMQQTCCTTHSHTHCTQLIMYTMGQFIFTETKVSYFRLTPKVRSET